MDDVASFGAWIQDTPRVIFLFIVQAKPAPHHVIELKEMRLEPLDTTDERQQRLATLFAPHFPEESQVPLDPGVLNERDTYVFWDLVGRPIQNAYVFERNVTFHHPDGSTSTGRIDLYKRGCYVLEAK